MSLYIFINGETLAPPSATMSALYSENKDEDGFLYISYASENTFGK